MERLLCPRGDWEDGNTFWKCVKREAGGSGLEGPKAFSWPRTVLQLLLIVERDPKFRAQLFRFAGLVMAVVRIIPLCMVNWMYVHSASSAFWYPEGAFPTANNFPLNRGWLEDWSLFVHMVTVVLFQCESVMRILDIIVLYMSKSISFPVVFLSLTVAVLYSLRIMNSVRRKCFKYIKQTVRCSHISGSGWHFILLLGILWEYRCPASSVMTGKIVFIYVPGKLGFRIQFFSCLIVCLFFLLLGILMEYYFLWRIIFFPSRAFLKWAARGDLHFSAWQ